MRFNPVPLPERTVIVRNKDKRYVYLTKEVVYKPELKTSRPTRVAIGKLDHNGMLIPNQNYFDLFGYTDDLIDSDDRSDFISVGPHFVMDSISRQNGLKELLVEIFEEDYANKILDLATYMIMSESNVMNYFEDYGYSHSLFNIHNFTDATIDRLFKEIKGKEIDLFIKAWVKMHLDKGIYISYDSTNMNSVAGNLELAEHGHAKDNAELPQVNLSLGYDQVNHIPMFYELYPGSIIDNSECEKMVERAKMYGCEAVGFVLDRGYFSTENIKYFERNGYDYILMTKGNAKFIKEAIDQCRAKLINGYKHYIDEYEIYGTTVELQLFKEGKKQYVHVYYNGVEAEQEKIKINQKFKKMEEELEGKKEKKIKRKEDVAYYEKYYKLGYDENGYFINYQRKEEKIRELMEHTGYFSIITSKAMSASEALGIYRDRDAVEKIFRMEKTYLGQDVFRVHSEEHLESKVFISFIGLIMRNEIYKSMKELYKKNRKEYTVPKAIREYERLGLTKLSDGEYHLRYKLTSKQKKLMKAIGKTEIEYQAFARKIKTS